MKKCSHCKLPKSLDEFGKNKSRKDGLQDQCKSCRKEVNKIYGQSHREQISARTARWRKNNPEAYKIIKKRGDARYYQKNKEKIDKANNEWVKNNRERSNEIKRQDKIKHRKERLPKIRAYDKKYKQEHPEKMAQYTNNRKARLAGAEGNHTDEEFILLKMIYLNKCISCGIQEAEAILLDKNGRGITRDHIVPLSIGGCNYIWNIQPMCMPCQNKKYNKIVDYRKEKDIPQEFKDWFSEYLKTRHVENYVNGIIVK